MRQLHSLAVFTLALVLSVSMARGQKKGQFLPADPFVMTTVSYVIDAHIAAESSLVAATMQIKYRNTSDDTLTELCLQSGNIFSPVSSAYRDSLPLPNGHCFIDSISMHGVTIGGDSLTFDSSLLKVRLPGRLLPGKTGYFQIAFRTKPAGAMYDDDSAFFLPLVNWYPKVCRYGEGAWRPDSAMAHRESEGERADYELGINIDSSLSLVFAAHHLNEKHHYGLLRGFAEGVVYEDFTNRYAVGIDGKKYRPVFDRAEKLYLLRTANVAGVPIIVSKQPLRDRIKDDSLAVEVCYRVSDSALWGGHVASSTYELLRGLISRLGSFSPGYITVVESDGNDMGALSERLLLMPRTIDDPDLLYTALAFELAALWRSGQPTDSTSEGDARPAVVRELLTARFAADTDKMIDRYNTWCNKHDRANGDK